MDEIRVSKGIARWTSNFTPPASPYGAVATVTSQKEFGTASGLFDGSGSYLSLADSNDWNFGAGDFTIDFWVLFNSTSDYQMFLSQRNSATPTTMWRAYKDANGALEMTFRTAGVWTGDYITANLSWNTGQWYHIAFVRNGASAYIFVDGVSKSVTENVAFGTLPDVADTLNIGVDVDKATSLVNGWMDEIRVSKGIARWISNFTPPSAPYDSQTPGANNVGIGTASPNYTLDVNGNVNATAYYGNGANLTGVGDTKYSDTRFKSITFTRNVAAAGADVAYTGIGFRPQGCLFFAMNDTIGNVTSFGGMDSAPNSGFVGMEPGGVMQQGSAAIAIYGASGGQNQMAWFKSYDADGFTLTWTKYGSPIGTAYIKAFCFR